MRLPYAAVAGLAAFLVLAQAQAADIVIDDPSWLKLTAEERAEVEKELRAIGVLEPDDRIVVKQIKDNTISEQDFKDVVIHGGAAIAGGGKALARKAGCAAKNWFNRDKCGKLTDAAAFKDCQASEKARHDAVVVKC